MHTGTQTLKHSHIHTHIQKLARVCVCWNISAFTYTENVGKYSYNFRYSVGFRSKKDNFRIPKTYHTVSFPPRTLYNTPETEGRINQIAICSHTRSSSKLWQWSTGKWQTLPENSCEWMKNFVRSVLVGAGVIEEMNGIQSWNKFE